MWVSVGCNVGALILRIGFGARYTIIIIRIPQNSIGNYLGPYSSFPGPNCEQREQYRSQDLSHRMN